MTDQEMEQKRYGILDELRVRGCDGLRVRLQRSAVVARLIYVHLQYAVSGQCVTITAEDYDVMVQQLRPQVTTPQVLEAALQMESAVSS
ncbi:MAG: hypothetical protein AAF571_03380 [Verrucomicrobiota bacterium]